MASELTLKRYYEVCLLGEVMMVFGSPTANEIIINGLNFYLLLHGIGLFFGFTCNSWLSMSSSVVLLSGVTVPVVINESRTIGYLNKTGNDPKNLVKPIGGK